MLLTLEKRLREALSAHIAHRYGVDAEIVVELPKQAAHGDLATPVCFGLAKALRRAPRQIAAELVAELPGIPGIRTLEVAGAGYVNLRFDRAAYALGVLAGTDEPAVDAERPDDAGLRERPQAVHFRIGHGRRALVLQALL